MREIKLIELDNILKTCSDCMFVYSSNNANLVFKSVLVDFDTTTLLCLSDDGFFRTPIISRVFWKEGLHNAFVLMVNKNEWIEIEYIQYKT